MADGLITIGIVPDDSQWTRTMRHLATNSSRTINQAINAHVQPLGKITGEASEFQKSLAASNARVIAFGASTGAIFAVRSAFRHLVQSTIDVEKEMSEINAIFQMGGQQLKRFSNELFSISSAYSTAFGDAAKAAAEFARQGLTVEETLKRTSAALALSRISGTNMEQSVASLTSIMNTFVKESLTAEEVVNRLVAVDQSYAVSAGDLAEALSRVSSSAADANVSLNQTMALITAAKQITARTGSVIGNSFKTMFTRLQRPQVIDDLEAVGIKARDSQGKMRPMLDILRSLATQYDDLSASQKSFVAETVGGVYQINILKAIMRDLGGGMSIVDGAMQAASNSTDMVNRRMAILNDTISSQLIRTANSLKQVMASGGGAMLGGSMKMGLGSLDNFIKDLSFLVDSSVARGGEGPWKQLGANLAQGMLKGIGNALRGPGLQYIVLAMFKLFQRLTTFVYESTKELMNLNQTEKNRLAINEGIATWLGEQRQVLTDILNGQLSLNQATEMYLNSMKGAVSAAKDLQSVSQSMGEIAVTQVNFTPRPGAASGYIPALEVAEARRGGYTAGTVVNTTVQDGHRLFDVTANTAETITRVIHEGKAFDFINPKEGSPAANAHRAESIRRTGIDPYCFPKSQVKAGGFIPNLALPPELVATISGLGIDIPRDILGTKDTGASRYKMDAFLELPESMVTTFVQQYRSSPRALKAILSSMMRKGAGNLPLGNGPEMVQFLTGAMLNRHAVDNKLYPGVTPSVIESLAGMFTGKPVVDVGKQEAALAKTVRLRPQDVQRVFNLHAGTIPFIAAYEHGSDPFTPAKDRPELVSPLTFEAEGIRHEFSIPTPMFGYKGAGKLMRTFQDWTAMLRESIGATREFPAGQLGTMRGNTFELALKSMAEAEGIGVAQEESDTAPLDIYGSPKSILSQTNIKGSVAGLEIKAGALEATRSGNMAKKIFRTLAGEPGSATAKPRLAGPVGYVPKLVNIKPFDAKQGGIGIIDADALGKAGVKGAAFESLVYAAVATGKPLRIHYGPMTMGKTTASERIVNAVGGIGKVGGDYVTSLTDVDSDRFKQFIINKTDVANLDTGVFGLALSAASQVRTFYSPHGDFLARQKEMIARLRGRNRNDEAQHAEAIARKHDEKLWNQYAANIAGLHTKLGAERVSPYNVETPLAGRGFIPNLATMRRADVMRGLRTHGESMYENEFAKIVTKEALQNAIDATEHSPEQKIGVLTDYGSLLQRDESKRKHRIIVKDTGQGMLPEFALTKFLPGFTSGKEGSPTETRGQYGMAKIALLGGAQRFFIKSVARGPTGKNIRTIIKGTGQSWYDFAGGEGRIEYPDDMSRMESGRLAFGDLSISWGPTKEEQTGTEYRATIPQTSPKGSQIYLHNAYEIVDEVAKQALGEGGLKQQIYHLGRSGKTFQEPWTEYRKDKFKGQVVPTLAGRVIAETVSVPGATIRVKYNPNAKLEEAYTVPISSAGLFQTNSGWIGEDVKLPAGFAIDVQPNVGVLDEDYPWTPDREKLKGPAAMRVTAIIRDIAARSKKMEIDMLKRAMQGRTIGSTGVGLVDVSQMIPDEFLEQLGQAPETAVLATLVQKHFDKMKAAAVMYGGPAYEKAKFGGIALGAKGRFGVRVGTPQEGSEGLIFVDVLNLLEKGAGQGPKQRQGLAFGQNLAGTLMHELAHQVSHKEGETHAFAMSFLSGQTAKPQAAIATEFNKLQKTNPKVFAFLNDMMLRYSQMDLSGGAAAEFLKRNQSGGLAGSGFVPNLAPWPTFPNFATSKLGGIDVRKSSMGITNDYFRPQIDQEIDNLLQITNYQQRKGMMANLIGMYGPQYGQDLHTLLMRRRSARQEEAMGTVLKGFYGEQFAEQMLLNTGGLTSTLVKLPDIDPMGEGNFDYLSAFMGTDTLFEVKNTGKIGDYEKLVNKIRTAAKKYPNALRWILGNEETRWTAGGFIPNLAVDLDELSALTSIAARRRYLQQQAGRALGKGSSREVFDIGSGRVVKLALNEKGVAQNYVESSLADDDNPILARIFETDVAGKYLVAEKAEPLDSAMFKKMTGAKFSTFASEMRWGGAMQHRGGVKTTSAFAEQVRQWALSAGVLMGDLGRRANLGVVRRPDPEDLFQYEAPFPVIIDYGFNEDVRRRHYAPRRFGSGFIPNLASDELWEQVRSHPKISTEAYGKLREAPDISDAGLIRAAKVFGFEVSGVAQTSSQGGTADLTNLFRQAFGGETQEAFFRRVNSIFEREERIRGIPLSENERANIAFLQGLFKHRFPELADIKTGQVGKMLVEARDMAYRGTPNILEQKPKDFLAHINRTYVRKNKLRHSLLAIDLGIDDKVAPTDMPDRREDSISRYLYKRLRRHMERGRFAGGFIPNLCSAVADAVNRENRATSGRAMLGSDLSLRSMDNPLGLVAFDSRQGSPAGAIREHKALGQDIGEIRYAHTAGRGRIPNLALGGMESSADIGGFRDSGGMYSSIGIFNSVILAALMGMRAQGGVPSEAADRRTLKDSALNRLLVSDAERASAKLRLLTREFESMREKLMKGEQAVSSFGVAYQGAGDIPRLEGDLRSRFTALRGVVKPYEEAKERSQARLSKAGQFTAWGASLGGGMATQFAELSSASLGASVNEFSNGLTQAGQVLLTFPNKLGMIGAITFGIDSMVSAMEVYAKGLHNAERAFEVAQDKYTKTNAQMDALATSLNQYENMISDSSVSMEAIQREQRKYAETLALLSQSTENANLVARLAGATDSGKRQTIIGEEREKAAHRIGLQAGALGLQQYAAKRSSWVMRMFGVEPFGYSNEVQKQQLEVGMRGTATEAIATMSGPLKETLMAANSLEEFSAALDAARNSTDYRVKDSADFLASSFENLAKMVKGPGMNVVRRQIFNQLQIERADNTPERQAARDRLVRANIARQRDIDTAVNRERLAQRMFLNAGTLLGGRELDVKGLGSQMRLQRALVGGTALGETAANPSVATRQALANVMRLYTGERTMRRYEAATESQRVEAERQQKVEAIRGEGTRSLVNIFQENSESIVGSMQKMLGGSAYKPGTKMPEPAEWAAKSSVALSRGIQAVSRIGLGQFVKPTGELDTDKLIKTMVDNSGATNDMRDILRAGIQVNLTNMDVTKAVLEVNKQIAATNLDSFAEQQKINTNLAGVLQEMDFKQMGNYLGGIKNLLDRGSRRAMERSLVRGMTLMSTGRTPEARAMGAATFLKALQDMQVPLDRSGRTPLSQMINRAFAVGASNLAIVQQQSIGRVLGAVGRLTGGRSLATSAARELAGRAGFETAGAAFGLEYPSENEKIVREATSSIKATTDLFDTELTQSAIALANFTTTVESLKKNWESSFIQARQIREARTQEIDAANRAFYGPPEGRPATRFATQFTQDTTGQKAALLAGRPAQTLATFGAVALGSMLFSRFRRGGAAQQREVTAALEQVAGVGVLPPRGGAQARRLSGTERGMIREAQANAAQYAKTQKSERLTKAFEDARAVETAMIEREAIMVQNAERLGMSVEAYKKMIPEGHVVRPVAETTPRITTTLSRTIEPVVATSTSTIAPTSMASVPENMKGAPLPPETRRMSMQERNWYMQQSPSEQRRHMHRMAAVERTMTERTIRARIQAQRTQARAKIQNYIDSWRQTASPIIMSNRPEDYLIKPPVTDVAATKAYETDLAKLRTNPANRTGRRAWERLQERFGNPKARPGFGFSPHVKIGALAAGTLLLTQAAMAGQESQQEEETSPYDINRQDVTNLGAQTVGNAAMFGGGFRGLKNLQFLKKGAALALTGLISNRVAEGIGGGWGEAAGAAIDIGASAKFFGLARGGGGAVIGLGSELLRRKFTEKQFGYTAGAGQGMAGAMLAGAAFAGPAGAAIGGAAYGVSEGIQMRAETNALLEESRLRDADWMESIANRNASGITQENLISKAKQMAGHLYNREGVLQGMRESDQRDESGWGGMMMRLFHISKRQFGTAENKELQTIVEQRRVLDKALQSGDESRVLTVLRAIQATLVQQSREMIEQPEDKTPMERGTSPALHSDINVKISVEDYDKIPSELSDTIVNPLAQRLATLQRQVNEILNARNPMPAQITS